MKLSPQGKDLKDGGHIIRLLERKYPENIYQCKNCGYTWAARNKRHLTCGSHMSFEKESPCGAVSAPWKDEYYL